MNDEEFRPIFEDQFDSISSVCEEYKLFKAFRNNTGSHPEPFSDIECSYAASTLKRLSPVDLLDIASYRKFVIGLLASYNVTTLDIRERAIDVLGESNFQGDAKTLPFKKNSFDAVTSLCGIEHFGLGRYGDVIDLNADVKACKEICRVLKPGGHFILTTTISRGPLSLVFNAHKIYTKSKLIEMLNGFSLVDEVFYSRKLSKICNYNEVVDEPREWDLYMSCWKKS